MVRQRRGGSEIRGWLTHLAPSAGWLLTAILIFAILFFAADLPFDLYGVAISLLVFLYAIYLPLSYWGYKSKQARARREEELAEELYAERARHRAEKSDIQEYFMTWIHQIKTPITALKLLIDSQVPPPGSGPMKGELVAIENYTNMAIGYLKMLQTGQDMDIESLRLDDVLRPLLKRYAILFISRHIRLDYEAIDARVISDSTWLSLLIEQILSNSVKYAEDKSVSIRWDPTGRMLIIEDDGIGIKGEDLPRVFDRGYSGFNGRFNERSTGLGLYLAKQIADRLHVGLSLDSEWGRGTRVTLVFPPERPDLTDL